LILKWANAFSVWWARSPVRARRVVSVDEGFDVTGVQVGLAGRSGGMPRRPFHPARNGIRIHTFTTTLTVFIGSAVSCVLRWR
jgi:hypothetical protein